MVISERERERENERTFIYHLQTHQSVTYSIICLYAVVGCEKDQSPSKLAAHRGVGKGGGGQGGHVLPLPPPKYP